MKKYKEVRMTNRRVANVRRKLRAGVKWVGKKVNTAGG